MRNYAVVEKGRKKDRSRRTYIIWINKNVLFIFIKLIYEIFYMKMKNIEQFLVQYCLFSEDKLKKEYRGNWKKILMLSIKKTCSNPHWSMWSYRWKKNNDCVPPPSNTNTHIRVMNFSKANLIPCKLRLRTLFSLLFFPMLISFFLWPRTCEPRSGTENFSINYFEFKIPGCLLFFSNVLKTVIEPSEWRWKK